MSRLEIRSILVVMLLALACSRSIVREVMLPGYGKTCGGAGGCRPPFECNPDNICLPASTVDVGGECTFALECLDGLGCYDNTCQAEGPGGEGAVCTSRRDCEGELFCALAGLGGTCTAQGSGDLDEPCDTGADCAPGLVCDPLGLRCSDGFAAPFGESCQPFDPSACEPAAGLLCDPVANTCTGLGPDGAPIPPWSGAECAGSGDQQGAFRVLFSVPDVGSSGTDFFRLPFPNDARLASGLVDMNGFPTPPLTSVPVDLLAQYVDAIESEHDGFSPHQPVIFRFSGTPRFCNSCDNCAGCLGGSDDQIFVFDLSAPPSTPGWFWLASSGRTPYMCWNWLSLAPTVRGWTPGHTYAVIVTTGIKSSDEDHDGEDIVQDADFTAMLGATTPGTTRLDAAWQAYQPLRDWLATNPTFPSTTTVITGADLAAAAVFTIRNPRTLFDTLADAALALPAPSVDGALTTCTGASDTCSDPGVENFTEVQGSLLLPSFQEGTLPYLASGGDIARNGSGVPQKQADLSVQFSLSVPDGTPPAGGWPVVLYAHGTGGSFRSHIVEGVAAELADVDVTAAGGGNVQFAVLGIDQVAHGSRAGGSTLDPELLFFNFTNPRASRGNVLQGAVDQLMLARAIPSVSTALAAAAALGTLDATKVVFFGHSQGGTVGVLAMAKSPDFTTGTLSGAGGFLIDSLMNKTEPYNLPVIVRLVLAEPFTYDGANHPALGVLQAWIDDADPISFGENVGTSPLPGSVSKNVLHLIGVGDTFTPNVTAVNLAQQINVRYMDPDGSGLAPSPTLLAPAGDAKGNFNTGSKTRIAAIHEPTGGEDGHFVVFDKPLATQQMREFFATFVLDGAGVPTVVE